MKTIDYRENLTEREFLEEYVKPNRPVVVKDSQFEAHKWLPSALLRQAGDLHAQIYDTLFSLQDISTLAHYMKENFGRKEVRERVPYVRWYNQLKNVDHAWGDDAFARVSRNWKKPAFLPSTGFLVPPCGEAECDPVREAYPYRGILVAAKGARTRLHRDPFCSDAVVLQFYGVKDFVMYHPDRADELRDKKPDSTSFGGFIDVRQSFDGGCEPEPDYWALANPGDVVYVPHGWLHDALVKEDSISITWNFVHELGSLEFIDYLMDDPRQDSEFEVLNYFYQRAGERFSCARDIIEKYRQKFTELEEMLAEAV